MKQNTQKLIFSLLICFVIVNNFIFFPNSILSWDVFGYYLYLPLKFIYHDIGLRNDRIIYEIIEKYNNTATFYQAMKMPDGLYVMKYTSGMAFFYMPFFLLGHFIALVSSYPADGFSFPYQFAVFSGGIVYAATGLVLLRKVLLYFFDNSLTILTLCITVFATNYLVHNTMYGQNAMPHNYLFFAYSLILYLTINWYRDYQTKHIIMLGVICGATILSRPTEVVCLFIPLLWGLHKRGDFFKKFKLFYIYRWQIVIFVLILLAFGTVQFVYWKIYAGRFLFNSYGGNAGEGLDILHPNIINVLFSFRKGWLIYTPVMIFALIGFYFGIKKNASVFFALSIYLIFNLYIVSCWSCWWYAQSFGQRALIPSYPVLAIGLGYFLKWLINQRWIIKNSLSLIMLLLTGLNIFQTFQFHRGVIDGDRMTKQYYFAVFGKTNASEEERKLLLVQRSFNEIENFNNSDDYIGESKKEYDFEKINCFTSDTAFAGEYSLRLNSSTTKYPLIDMPYKELTLKDHAWIKISMKAYFTGNIKDSMEVIIHFTHNGYPYKFVNYKSDKMPVIIGKWVTLSFTYLTPEVRNCNDRLRIFLKNSSTKSVYIDDVLIEVFEKKEKL